MTAEHLIRQLSLTPLPGEGGYYRRVYLDPQEVDTARLGRFSKPLLPLTSVIYYLTTVDSYSGLHWLAGNEVWTWIGGDSLEQVVVKDDRSLEVRKIGMREGMSPVSVVPGGCWQGTRILSPVVHGYALCSTVMSPAYDERDFRLADGSFLDSFNDAESRYLRQFLGIQHSEVM